MPFGSKRFFETSEPRTAADQHATLSPDYKVPGIGVDEWVAGALSTNYSKFGQKSFRVPVSQGQAYSPYQIEVFPKDSNFYFDEDNAWTVEWWQALGDVTFAPPVGTTMTYANIPTQFASDPGGTYIPHTTNISRGVYDGNFTYRFSYNNGSTDAGISKRTDNVAIPDWVHCAITCSPNPGANATVRWHVNGSAGNTYTTWNNSYSTRTVRIGAWGGIQDFNWGDGVYFSNIRISNTVRYSGSYSVPTAPFTPDANTLAIFLMNTDTNDSAF